MSSKTKDEANISKISCKNCGTVFVGKFCPNCGQSAKEFERPFSFLFIDLMGNIFAFDTRFWKTFKAILFKPGTLANEFVIGHRVRYMPPFRFYVFVSFIFFLLLNFNMSSSIKNQREERSYDSTTISNSSEAERIKDSIVIAEYGFLQIRQSESPIDTNITNTLDSVNKDDVNEFVNVDRINRYPEVYIGRMFKYLSWTVFFLMPFYGFLLWIFYRKSQSFYVTNLILAINQHSFAFIIFLLIILLSFVLPDGVSVYGNFILLFIPVYVFIGQKRLYKQKGWVVFLKMAGVGIFYFSLLIAILLIVMVLAFEFNFSAITT